jgi:multiple sugar transport system ATP-binding protein
VAEIRFDNVSKVFAGDVVAVSELTLGIADGELMVLVGPSGCGKTTALRMAAGLEQVTAGTLFIGERNVNLVPAKQRDVAMVFQNYALYPHMTVRENMAFALKTRKIGKTEVDRRVNHAAHVLGIEELLRRRPRELSGGQRQRVAMGRAIVREPQAFLMDEPLSNLDAKLRVQMRSEIARLQQTLGVTTIYVTHDQTEAMTLGSRVSVMRKGVLQQVGAPEDVYSRPANLFVAGFIGSPAMNLVRARLVRADGVWLEFGSHRLQVPQATLDGKPALARYIGNALVLGVRPESIGDAALNGSSDESTCLAATVELREALGSELLLHFPIDAPPVDTEEARELARDLDAVAESDMQRSTQTWIARTDPDSTARQGDRGRFAVDTRKLYYFDPASGDAIGRAA